MSQQITNLNEQKAALAFSEQSTGFDEAYESNAIIQYKRQRVRDHILEILKPASSILELNAGTGEDAIFFARLGHYIHATDIAWGMQQQLEKKINAHGLHALVRNEICSYTQLEKLQHKGPYDLVFSNFAGLNCTNELKKVFESFDNLLKPGGQIVLVLLPRFCFWEILLMFKGKFRTAFRRFLSSKGRKAKIDGNYFTCWYHSPKKVTNLLAANYKLTGLEGLSTIVPPSYIENFANKYPRAFSFLRKKEDRYKSSWPWKCIGDYYIISFQKK